MIKEIYTPYLIQRCNVIDNPRPSKRISENLSTQYMGSAEFEFGSLPRSLRDINENIENYELVKVKEIKNSSGKELLIFMPKMTNELQNQYINHLKVLRKGQGRTKEYTGFSQLDEHKTFSKTDVWWDIDNNIFFSFKPPIMKVIGESVKSSVKWMDEQKSINAINVVGSLVGNR